MISEEELSAYIDGELPAARARMVAQAVAADAVLAARAEAFRTDRDRLQAAFAHLAAAPVPDHLLQRIEAAVERPAAVPPPALPVRRLHPAAPVLGWALAACVALAVGLSVLQLRPHATQDALLTQAFAARSGTMAAAAHFTAPALPDDAAEQALLTRATGLPVRVPDLRRQGWHLAALDTYRDAASLRYANAAGQTLFVFVRRSAGAPRFDITKRGGDRVCVWQDEVVAAVMMGDMSAGQMMRVAGAAYASLDL